MNLFGVVVSLLHHQQVIIRPHHKKEPQSSQLHRSSLVITSTLKRRATTILSKSFQSHATKNSTLQYSVIKHGNCTSPLYIKVDVFHVFPSFPTKPPCFVEEPPPARAVAAVQAEVAPDPPRPDWPTQGCQNPRPGIGK